MSQIKVKQLLGPNGSNNGSLVVYDSGSGITHWSSDLTSGVLLPTGNTANRPSSPAISMVRFNTDINEAEIYNANGWGPIGSPALIATLPDGPGSLQANLGLKVNSLGTALQFYTIVPNTTTFAALVDGPGSLQANMAIKVNSLGTALQYYTPTSSFSGLTDGPGSLQANMGVQVNSSATALQYYSIVPGLTTFASLVDGPGSLHANLGIKVNSLGTALQYYTISAGISTFTGLTDGPGSLQANMSVAVNSLGTALQFYPLPIRRYRFQANFTGTTYPNGVTNYPTGWSFAFGSGSTITVTHNIGETPLYITILSCNPSLDTTTFYEIPISAQTSGVQFYYSTSNVNVFTLANMTTTICKTSASPAGYLFVDCYFA